MDDEKTLALERQKATLDVIRQLVTQVLTLCTSLIAASIALAKLAAPFGEHGWLFSSMLAGFSAAVLFGLLALGAVISSLINTSLDVGNARAVQLLAGLELVAFAVGLIFAGYFAHCLAS